MEDIRNRLQAWTTLLSARHVAIGRTWYRDAHTFARELSARYGVPLPNVVGVIAVLSVQNRWPVNCRDAESFCKAYAEGIDLASVSVATYTGQKDKAIAILHADADADIPALVGSAKWAMKTRAFYANILDPEHSLSVTIDRWILRALDLESVTMHKALYRRIARAFSDIASTMDLLPHELQAAIWHCVQDIARIADWDDSRPGTGLENSGDSVAPF